MKTMPKRKTRKPKRAAFHVAVCGRERVPVYRRRTPTGTEGFLVANHSGDKRRLDSYPTAELAIEAAGTLARRLSEKDTLAASITREQAIDFASATQTLKPLNVTLTATAATVAECFKHVAGLVDLSAACKFYAARFKQTSAKRVADVVAELLTVKAARGASKRYLEDLRNRLTRFAEAFQKNIGDVTTADVQAWLDSLKLSPQTCANFRRVVFLLFKFALARGYTLANPVSEVESIKFKGGKIEIFTPTEIAKLLEAASPDFLPVVALGAFAGLRTAEILRLKWADVDLAGGFIHVSADAAKTASRRLVPIQPNLSAWLRPYSQKRGLIWCPPNNLQEARDVCVKAAGVKWKTNACRHSFASYRMAETMDAGKVALEMGNSPAMIFKHYRELVKPAAAKSWFAVAPVTDEKILAAPTFAAAATA